MISQAMVDDFWQSAIGQKLRERIDAFDQTLRVDICKCRNEADFDNLRVHAAAVSMIENYFTSLTEGIE